MHLIVQRNWWAYVLRGSLAVVFGVAVWVAAIIFPGITLSALAILLGAYFFVEGAIAIVAAIRHRKEKGYGILLLEGIGGLVIGTLAFVWTEVTAMALVFFVAAWALVTGIMEIVTAVQLRKAIKREWLLALSGVLSVALGIIVLAFPAAGALGIMWMIGAYAVGFGSLLIALGVKARRLDDLQGQAGKDSVEHRKEHAA